MLLLYVGRTQAEGPECSKHSTILLNDERIDEFYGLAQPNTSLDRDFVMENGTQ